MDNVQPCELRVLPPDLMDGELISDIYGYEGFYAITSLGRVWAYPKTWYSYGGRICNKKGMWRKLSINEKGYCIFTIVHKRRPSRTFFVHKLVAQAWVLNPDPENKIYVNHKDGVKTNNTIENLEWCTHQENMNHAWNELMDLELVSAKISRRISKTTQEQRNEIRRLYSLGGLTKKQIGAMFGVSKGTIVNITNGNMAYY